MSSPPPIKNFGDRLRRGSMTLLKGPDSRFHGNDDKGQKQFFNNLLMPNA